MSICKKIDIGRLPFGVPEGKVEWQGSPIPRPVLYTRQSHIVAYVEVCGPDDILNSLWEDVRSCALGAAGAAGVAAIVSSPAGALPAFKVAFSACLTGKLGEKAASVDVALSTEQISGPWVKATV